MGNPIRLWSPYAFPPVAGLAPPVAGSSPPPSTSGPICKRHSPAALPPGLFVFLAPLLVQSIHPLALPIHGLARLSAVELKRPGDECCVIAAGWLSGEQIEIQQPSCHRGGVAALASGERDKSRFLGTAGAGERDEFRFICMGGERDNAARMASETPPTPTYVTLGRKKRMAAAVDFDDEAAMAMFNFHETRAGVRGLVESGVTTVPPLFVAPTPPVTSPRRFSLPSVDLSLPRARAAVLVRAFARSYGIFQVTSHGVPPGAVASALSAIRAFNEQPFAARSRFYTTEAHASRAVTYATVPIPRPTDAEPATAPLMCWRDSLLDPDVRGIPTMCRDTLLEYRYMLTSLGWKVADLLLEGIGVGAERLGELGGCLMQCHYHPPREHTDAGLFTVLAQDGVGGLQVRLDDGDWVDVAPVPGALLVNVVSNDEYKSMEHRVVSKSTQEARVSIALFFNPVKHGKSDFFGPLPELVTAEKPARYREFDMDTDARQQIRLGARQAIVAGSFQDPF
ncbi:hypothetical protein HU200_005396 [Digitaria exilis]|uniref:Fe2OG dioxygenase domain-containing protein n=1 Tax=Digitaria exilis TaxID=1010633 RepID=A0A835KWJ1_9POAL|nr:hypothetical protein HU200_005396 [Digitaria exilis]